MQISETLDQLAISTLNNALEVLARGDELWPIAVIATDDDFEFQQFSGDSPEACREAARAYVSAFDEKARAYAICFDGTVQLAAENGEDMPTGEFHDALIVEFGERGQAKSFSLATPYRGAHAPGGFEIVADTSLVEEDEQLLA